MKLSDVTLKPTDLEIAKACYETEREMRKEAEAEIEKLRKLNRVLTETNEGAKETIEKLRGEIERLKMVLISSEDLSEMRAGRIERDKARIAKLERVAEAARRTKQNFASSVDHRLLFVGWDDLFKALAALEEK